MDKLTSYLIEHSKDLIGVPIHPTKEVLEREDASLYVWRKMGMSHSIMRKGCGKDETSWRTISPAAHVYPLSKVELDFIVEPLNRLYFCLRECFSDKEINNSFWYVIRDKERTSKWFLFKDNDSLGDIEEDNSVDYPTSVEEALTSLLYLVREKVPDTLEIANCVVFPFTYSDWKYSGMVVMLGKEETTTFRKEVVEGKADD